MAMEEIITPKPLHKGSKIAIISPATIVKEEYIDGAAEFLRGEGLEPVIMPHAKGPADGSYASSGANRLDDLLSAWRNPEIDGILCARGGYGAAHLLPHLDREELRRNAKWLVGFSDISALHAGLLAAGIKSIHGPMAKHLCQDPTHPSTQRLMELLRGARMDYRIDGSHPFNRRGEARGRLVGGNLAVINGLAATPYDIFARADSEDIILFIEDISEAIYAVERMLWRLAMAGTLGKIKGLIVGRFTEYRPDRNFPDMEHMIDALLRRIGPHGIPVVFDFPVGHVTENMPLVHGADVTLSVSDQAIHLRED